MALAKQGQLVLYVEAFLRTIFAPASELTWLHGSLARLSLKIPGRPDPFRQPLDSELAGLLAATILSGLRQSPQLIMVQLPFWAPLAIELRRRSGAPIVYDRIDFHSAFPGVPDSVALRETALLQAADRVVATSKHLAQEAEARGGVPVAVVPNAVAWEDLELAALRRDGEPPVFGYVGALASWFDAVTIGKVAQRSPGWRFRLAGRIESDSVAQLGRLANVEFLGEIEYRNISSLLAGFDVALIPFLDSPLTRAVDPVKLYEYLACGLPVVASPLPQISFWKEPFVYFASTPREFGGQLNRALQDDSDQLRKERRSSVENQTWCVRARSLLDLVGNA